MAPLIPLDTVPTFKVASEKLFGKRLRSSSAKPCVALVEQVDQA
jgi:hypothetical protein